ncbi:receptor-like protein kinase [Seminavis robusta]|uniref:Receptor-like protein kinase n=1 Tax=Seminavis robusta TaxID=568900 RepID=A0A9N8DMU6_9STRA|nr:receptor-like protein kinase [Seminavis robusta]|eukprot:Sro221_g090970.1 receptor-like protein kinase (524) ;mRNA; r:32705-34276
MAKSMDFVDVCIETERVNSREPPTIYAAPTGTTDTMSSGSQEGNETMSSGSSTSNSNESMSDYGGSEATEDEISVLYSMQFRPYSGLRRLCEVPLTSAPGSESGLTNRSSVNDAKSSAGGSRRSVLISNDDNGYECQQVPDKPTPDSSAFRTKLLLFVLVFMIAFVTTLTVLLVRHSAAKTKPPTPSTDIGASSPEGSASSDSDPLLARDTSKQPATVSIFPTQAPSSYPTSATNDAWNYLLAMLGPYTKREILLDASRPQGRAFLQIMMDHVDSYESLTTTEVLQSYAVLTLYFSTSPKTWDLRLTESTSMLTVMKSQVCAYWKEAYIVDCVENGYQVPVVRTIALANAKLSGSLPEEICLLEHLERLDLTSNMLTGSIPACLGNSKSLKTLLLSKNSLSSQLPRGMLLVTTLEELEVTDNRLGGDLQVLIEGTSRNTDAATNLYRYGESWLLRRLNLDGNSFTGEVPAFLGALGNLKSLTLHGNDLTGVIDDMLCDRTQSGLKVLTADCQRVSCDCCTACF